MRQIIAIAWLLFLFHLKIIAQQEDKNWICGVNPFISSLSFEGSNVIVDSISTTLQSFNTTACMSNKQGKLLFFTNGVSIYNVQNYIMRNGDSLNYPNFDFQTQYENGLAANQGAIILPKPNNEQEYYIFHNAPDTIFNGTGGYMPMKLLYSVVDMSLDSGRGAVVIGKKNIPIIENTPLSWSRMAACRHANGRDWWIIKPMAFVNIFYKFLLTPEGIQGPFIQQIGDDYGSAVQANEQMGFSVFSSDGKRYANGTSNSLIGVMDFDRCSGLFSNPFTLNLSRTDKNVQDSLVTYPFVAGLAFSPSGRFLYANSRLYLVQYDLEATNPQDSFCIATFSDSCFFCDYWGVHMMQLAPDSKLYISTWAGGASALHVINHPDVKGAACDFQRYGLTLPNLASTPIPYFPNYRLGADSTSSCDTIRYTGVEQVQKDMYIKIYPNPANTYASVKYFIGDKNEGVLSVYNVLGEKVYTQKLNAGGQADIDVSNYSTGIYLVKVLTADKQELLNTKLMVTK